MIKKLLLVTSFLLAIITLSSMKNDANIFHNYLQKKHNKGVFNGTAVIIKNDSVLFKGAFGLASKNKEDTLSINSVFRLGSVSKQFTAMAIMLLQEKKLLEYDQTVSSIIPGFPYKKITVRHLLNHTSGLADYMALCDQGYLPSLEWNDPKRLIENNNVVIELLIKNQPKILFEAGNKYQYSNTGYILLASIVEKISNDSFEKFLSKNIFIPLRMDASSVYKYVLGKDPLLPNRVYSFYTDKKGNKLGNDFHYLNGVYGDGGIYSNIPDLIKWDKALYTEKLVKQSTLNEAFIGGKLNNGKQTDYGFGWKIIEWSQQKKVVEHTGGWVGFSNIISRDIENKTLIILLTNNTKSGRKYLTPIMKCLKKKVDEKK
jgi:CubicO group peptidase (beta-lactamase class C family)